MHKNFSSIAVLAGLTFLMAGTANAGDMFASGIPSDWTKVGNAGTSGANGVVGLAPGSVSDYGWVSTANGVSMSGLGLGHETNGSTLTSSSFTVNAGAVLTFSFDYVTSDGAGFSDYAWAKLINTSTNQSVLLFTARTTPNGNSVPGFGMPTIAANIDPSTVTIHSGTSWAPLGSSSNTCYSGGCGNTGWVNSEYDIASAGTYQLQFGVVNWSDTAYQSGLAFDGLAVNGAPINAVPEPETYAMLMAGLGLLGAISRRKKS